MTDNNGIDNKLSLGSQLREARTKAKLNQDELGNILGISRKMVGYLENDKQQIMDMNIIRDWWKVCETRGAIKNKKTMVQAILSYLKI